ncbi:MAG: glycosyltransferase family 9 protein [Candidatus Omnitrophica bacterium]|nr:glycosyltransferase family 9 protein [Candidatus Omnitrophota bacterium]
MKIRYLRWLDKHIGLTLCFILFILRAPGRIFALRAKEKLDGKYIKKILIIKFLGFGSITLAYDFFQAIRKNYPGAYLCALTLKQNAQIYEISGLFDKIIYIENKSFRGLLLNTLKMVLLLKKQHFDVAFDLEFTSRFSAIITYLVNARRRIGFAYEGVWRGNFFTDTLKFREDEKLSASYLKLATLLDDNIKAAPHALKLDIKEADRNFVDELLRKAGLSGIAPLIGMNINASELSFLRRWPQEYFVLLAEELIRKYSAHIIFIGDKNDSAYVAKTIAKITFKEKIHNFAGLTSMAQLACLLSGLGLFISNDSGPLHLAVYVGTPTVSFFGPETPLIYGPEGERHIVFYKKMECSPCIRVKNYKHFHCVNNDRCLRQIKPSEVISEIQRRAILR